MKIQSRYTLRGWAKTDYAEFLFSVGGIFLLAFVSTLLSVVAVVKHISVPQQVFAIPLGFIFFACAWVWDSIAHRTIYRDKIDLFEFKIHNFMVYGSGLPVLFTFVLAYWWPGFMMPFIFTFLFLKTMYSVFDEFGAHWPRFREGRSDMIEMVAHYFQFIGNLLYDFAWIWWIYAEHYRGAKEIIIETGKLLRHLV